MMRLNELVRADLWGVITLWTVVGCMIVYFVAGVLACRVIQHRSLLVWVPLASAVVGGVLGFCSGGVSGKHWLLRGRRWRLHTSLVRIACQPQHCCYPESISLFPMKLARTLLWALDLDKQ